MRSVLDAPAPIERAVPSKQLVGRPAFLAFVADGETERLLQECATQLALGQGTILRGGITRAIEHLGQHRSPHILIVDVTGVDLPISKVNELADVCEPGVAVVAIGNRNEIGLYRDLLHAGVADYVVKPVNQQLLAKALTSGRAHTGESSPIHKKLGSLVAFVGARGGVGTTTLAVNTAWYLAHRQSRRVALVDLDLQIGDCALALDIKPTSGLREALANPLRIDNTLLERVMTPVGERLFVLSSEEPLAEDLHFTAVAVETLIAALREQFHYVIVDVPRIPAAPYRRVLDMADFCVLVADQTLRSVRDTVRLRTVLGDRDGKRRNILVVNRHGEGGRHAVTLHEIQHVVEVKPKSVIPFQPTLFTTVAGASKIAAARRGKFTDAIAGLALELSGRPPERRRWWRSEK
ncbi:MAG TPA: AAA family ATPase [Caldimonas sp.]|nr:AAA family ATPase [Caldimonas sp.]